MFLLGFNPMWSLLSYYPLGSLPGRGSSSPEPFWDPYGPALCPEELKAYRKGVPLEQLNAYQKELTKRGRLGKPLNWGSAQLIETLLNAVTVVG